MSFLIDTQSQQSEGTHLRKPTITKDGSRDQNREWEVGHNTRYDEIDDERQLKRKFTLPASPLLYVRPRLKFQFQLYPFRFLLWCDILLIGNAQAQ